MRPMGKQAREPEEEAGHLIKAVAARDPGSLRLLPAEMHGSRSAMLP